MAEAAVEFLLQNLKELFSYNAHLIHELKDQVGLLNNDLKMFRAFLKEAAKRRNKNEALKEIVNQIRDVVYEAEDALDIYITQAAVHDARSSSQKTFHKIKHTNQKINIAQEIESIRAKMKRIDENIIKCDGFLFQQEAEATAGNVKNRQSPVVEENNVVGFKDEAEKIINLVKGESEELEAISIVGMPGIGKTTLAKMIYRDPSIEYEFYSRAWVYVSQEYSRKDVFLNILRQFSTVSDNLYNMDDEALAGELCKVLEKEKYIIVLDDVWSKEAWDDLKVAFPNNKKHSRILLTTRMMHVARHANNNVEPHSLRFLNNDESWELLKWKALGSKECPRDFETHGMQIVDACKGLPLALVVIGGILRDNGNKSHWWKKVAGNVRAYVVHDREKTMENFIKMSFNHLPYHIKACFLYFGMFPEDFQIPVWKLVRLWIAEGFIEEIQGISLEDTAEEYLEDLINRNLVMIGEWRSNGKIKTCHVHDMLHLFCRNQAAEEKFFQEINLSKTSNPELERYRRLCTHSNLLSYISSKPVGRYVRSFLCFSTEDFELPLSHISTIPREFKLLRVLDSKSMRYTRLPNELTRLIHLRYLVLSCCFKSLPANLSCLWNLQTLIIETSSSTLEIKANVWKMSRLRHIKTNSNTSASLPDPNPRKSVNNTDTLGNLTTLSTISPESCSQDVFVRVPYLKKLGIRGRLSKLFNSFDSVGKLASLENLKLLNDVCDNNLNIDRFPQNCQFPPNLAKLTLASTHLDWKHMSTLGMLDSLEILKLKDNAFKGKYWQTEDGGFPILNFLYIDGVNLVSWHASAHHFPRLRSLYLKHCPELEAIPFGFADIIDLQVIDLHRTTKSAVASAKKIQQHKNTMKDKQSNRGMEFKLSVYPPDQS